MPPKRKKISKAVAQAADIDVTRHSLPVELLEMLFQELSHRHLEHIFEVLNSDDEIKPSARKWASPLVACSAVNRYWHAVVNRMLYRVVVIASPESMTLFHRSAKSNKELLSLISSFSVDYWYKPFPRRRDLVKPERARRQAASSITWEVIHMFKSLYHFGIGFESLRPLPDKLKPPSFLKGLRSLSFRGDFSINSKDALTAWIARVGPTLERLNIKQLDHLSFNKLSPTPCLQSLSLHSSLDSTSEATRSVAQHISSGQIIQDLSIGRHEYDENSVLELCAIVGQHTSTLLRLHLGLCFTGSQADMFYTRLASALLGAERLHTLSLSIWDTPPPRKRETIINAIPPNVRILKLQFQDLEYWLVPQDEWTPFKRLEVYIEEVEAVLERVNAGVLNQLRTVVFGAAMFTQSKLEPGWNTKPRKESESRRRKVVKAGAAQGVHVRFVAYVEDHLPWMFVS